MTDFQAPLIPITSLGQVLIGAEEVAVMSEQRMSEFVPRCLISDSTVYVQGYPFCPSGQTALGLDLFPRGGNSPTKKFST